MKNSKLFKLTFKDGATFYGIHSTHKTAESYKKDIFSIAKNNISKNRSTTAVWRKMYDLNVEDFSSELVGDFSTKSEANRAKSDLMTSDSNSINILSSTGGRSDAKTKALSVHKRNSIEVNGSVYVSALRVDIYPSLNNRFSTSDNIAHPTKGRFFKITSPNVTRI